jgi:hypothetical protein
VVAAKGHIGNYEGAMHGAANGAGVVEHLVHGDGKGIFVAKRDHGERVADEEEIYSGFVNEAGAGVVICGERGDWLALALHFAEGGHGDFGKGNCRLRGTRASGKVREAHVVSSATPRTQDAARTS